MTSLLSPTSAQSHKMTEGNKKHTNRKEKERHQNILIIVYVRDHKNSTRIVLELTNTSQKQQDEKLTYETLQLSLKYNGNNNIYCN